MARSLLKASTMSGIIIPTTLVYRLKNIEFFYTFYSVTFLTVELMFLVLLFTLDAILTPSHTRLSSAFLWSTILPRSALKSDYDRLMQQNESNASLSWSNLSILLVSMMLYTFWRRATLDVSLPYSVTPVAKDCSNSNIYLKFLAVKTLKH